ncbi:MAG: 3-deoxy-manno-octulosonate cytidylyltransferase [Rhodospirillales bacterium]|nr:MAG: 3-deoxy-manno-octulosonate cytidylyltransferase [Rhodospirillales bacterium]
MTHMDSFSQAIVVIPARMASTRLPGKPLADIHGQPMIVRVLRRAEAAGIGPVLVAAADQAIADAVTAAGGRAVLTRPDLPSGSDRVFEAVEAIDPEGCYPIVVNLQGDLPCIEAEAVRAVLAPLADPAVQVATLVAVAAPHERDDPNVVKAVVALAPGRASGRALYFSRAAVPSGDGVLFHHIGIYAYRRAALARFVRLPQGILERRERLEQLRLLEHGMRIDAALVDTVPLGVDTPDDLARVRRLLADQPR